jgi:hypothetical protein
MAAFEELQDLWQQQPDRATVQFDARGLSEELRRFGRNQMWINGAKVLLTIFVFYRLMSRTHGSVQSICGTVLLLTGIVIYLVLDWRNQIGLSRLDFSAPSAEFVRLAYERLRHQLNPMKRVFWLEVVCMAGGLNLIILARPSLSPGLRIANHVGATALPFFAYLIGIKVREFRFKRECGAVMERLKALLQSLEEHAA